MRSKFMLLVVPVLAVAGCAGPANTETMPVAGAQSAGAQSASAETSTARNSNSQTVAPPADLSAAPVASARTLPAPVSTPLANVTLDCGGTEITAEVFDGHLEAVVFAESVTLNQEVAASGVRYANGEFVLWEHQGDWLMITNYDTDNEQTTECTVIK